MVEVVELPMILQFLIVMFVVFGFAFVIGSAPLMISITLLLAAVN